MDSTDLSEELRIYEQRKDQLIADGHTGKFAVVGAGDVLGVWETYEDALQAGYAKLGLTKPFLVKKIQGIEVLQFFTREIQCPA